MTWDSSTLAWAKPEDAPLVGQLITALLAELSGSPAQCDSAKHAKVAADLLADPEGFAVLLAFDVLGRGVGVLTLSRCAAVYAGGTFGEIAEFYVDPPYRSGGLGARMMAEAVAEARRRAWPRLEVGAPDQPAWQRTLDFYHRNGFTDVGPRLKLSLT